MVVDLQEKLLPAIADGERVLANSVLLLRLAEVLALPVVLTTQYRRGLGPTVPEVLAAAPGVDAARQGDLRLLRQRGIPRSPGRARGRDQLVVAGIESHICVAQTVLGALERGYAVHVASDAVGSRTAENRAVGLARMERAGALVSSTEMAIYELLGRSDAAAFKKMLPLLK